MAGIASFKLVDVSHLDKCIVVNGNVFETSAVLAQRSWQAGDDLAFTMTQSEGIYKVDNLTQGGTLYFKVVGEPRSLLERGDVRQLKKTQWRMPIDAVDCAACLPPSLMAHDEHEVVVTGKGVFVTPASWQIDDIVSLVLSPGGSRTLINHTTSDGITLP